MRSLLLIPLLLLSLSALEPEPGPSPAEFATGTLWCGWGLNHPPGALGGGSAGSFCCANRTDHLFKEKFGLALFL